MGSNEESDNEEAVTEAREEEATVSRDTAGRTGGRGGAAPLQTTIASVGD